MPWVAIWYYLWLQNAEEKSNMLMCIRIMFCNFSTHFSGMRSFNQTHPRILALWTITDFQTFLCVWLKKPIPQSHSDAALRCCRATIPISWISNQRPAWPSVHKMVGKWWLCLEAAMVMLKCCVLAGRNVNRDDQNALMCCLMFSFLCLACNAHVRRFPSQNWSFAFRFRFSIPVFLEAKLFMKHYCIQLGWLSSYNNEQRTRWRTRFL